MFRNTTFAVLTILLAAVSSAQAAPIVTMTQSLATVPGSLTLDFFYSASAGTEFTNYQLDVTSSTGADLQDPNKNQTNDIDGDAADTWMNTPFSLLFGSGSAPTYVFNNYRPIAPAANAQPTARINWEVFSTDVGDGNTIELDPGPPAVNRTAPWHLARVLVALTGSGTAKFNAFDSASQGQGTLFTFNYTGAAIPEPTSFALLGLAMVGGFGFLRRRAA